MGRGITPGSAVLELGLGLCTLSCCSALSCSPCKALQRGLGAPSLTGRHKLGRKQLEAAAPAWVTGGVVLVSQRLSDESNHCEWNN